MPPRYCRLASGEAKRTDNGLSQRREDTEERCVNLDGLNICSSNSTKNSRGAPVVGGGASGMSCTETQVREDGEVCEDDRLESSGQRRAMIKDSWDFFRMVCSLMRDRKKLDEAFRRMQLDPVYPYINGMTGLNDMGDNMTLGGNTGPDKVRSILRRGYLHFDLAPLKSSFSTDEAAGPDLPWGVRGNEQNRCRRGPGAPG